MIGTSLIARFVRVALILCLALVTLPGQPAPAAVRAAADVGDLVWVELSP